MDHRQIITHSPSKRNGHPCIRELRITVNDILGWLASGMTVEEILEDYPVLTKEDILAAVQYAKEMPGTP